MSTKKATNDTLRFYLGSLYPLEDGKCYGYVVNTKIKFFIVTDGRSENDLDVQQASLFTCACECVSVCMWGCECACASKCEYACGSCSSTHHAFQTRVVIVLEQAFQRLHSEYIQMACNPFFKQDAAITAK